MKNLWFYFFHRKQTGKRICSKCHKQIKARHKWQFVRSKPRHKDCKNPELKPIQLPLSDLPLLEAENEI
jgi:hypothetical protein